MYHCSEKDVADDNLKGFRNTPDLSPIIDLPFLNFVPHASRNRIDIGK